MRLLVVFALFLSTLCLPVEAQQAQTFGPFVVYYNTMSTDLLAPEVARSYGITRSKSRALLNIALMRQTDNALGTALTAEVVTTATNLNGQLTKVHMREVREEHAIYYLGELRISHEETFDFVVSIKPEGENEAHTLRFRQQFYTR